MVARILLLTTLICCSSAWANAPEPTIEGNILTWSSVSAMTINVHRGDGSYVESLPGDATSWTALEPGSYYLVAANDGDWLSWPRSETVSVATPQLPVDPLLSHLEDPPQLARLFPMRQDD